VKNSRRGSPFAARRRHGASIAPKRLSELRSESARQSTLDRIGAAGSKGWALFLWGGDPCYCAAMNQPFSNLPWDNNSWEVAAQIAARRHHQMAAALMASNSSLTANGVIVGAPALDSPTLGVPLPLAAQKPNTPQLLLQTVIVPGEKTTQGTLIEAVALPWFELIEVFKKDPRAIFQIPPRMWEEIVAGAYRAAGYEVVILTPQSGDLGRDVIAVKKGIGSVRVIDQVKAYKPDHLVTAEDVRALVGVVQLDRASKGFLTTTSDFAPRIKTDPLLAQVMPHQIELINGEMLLKNLDEIAKRSKSK
jgi:restriction system protein